jgi:hypothetical protein
MNLIRREAGRYFSSRKKKHLKGKADELPTSSKEKHIGGLCRGISRFRTG